MCVLHPSTYEYKAFFFRVFVKIAECTHIKDGRGLWLYKYICNVGSIYKRAIKQEFTIICKIAIPLMYNKNCNTKTLENLFVQGNGHG